MVARGSLSRYQKQSMSGRSGRALNTERPEASMLVVTAIARRTPSSVRFKDEVIATGPGILRRDPRGHVFHDPAVVDLHDAAGAARERHVVRDDDERRALAPELREEAHDVRARRGVEVSRGLV